MEYSAIPSLGTCDCLLLHPWNGLDAILEDVFFWDNVDSCYKTTWTDLFCKGPVIKLLESPHMLVLPVLVTV